MQFLVCTCRSRTYRPLVGTVLICCLHIQEGVAGPNVHGPYKLDLIPSTAMQDKAPGDSRKRGAPEADEEDLPDEVRARLAAIKDAA